MVQFILENVSFVKYLKSKMLNNLALQLFFDQNYSLCSPFYAEARNACKRVLAG